MIMSLIFLVLIFVPHVFAQDPYRYFEQLNLPPGAIGPESAAFDGFGRGPYIGVSDGRILKYQGSQVGFVPFAYTAPNRSSQTCDGTTDPALGPICRRPYGVRFMGLSGIAYVLDAYLGLLELGPEGGQAKLLVNSAGGERFNLANAFDLDQRNGDIFITDTSQAINVGTIVQCPNTIADSSGRLIKYNIYTKEAKVLLDGLPAPGGPAVSLDGSFVLFAVYGPKQVRKFWLTGPKANNTEILLNFTEYPIKIESATIPGQYWVAVNEIVFGPPRTVTALGYKFDSFGRILLRKNFSVQYGNVQVNSIKEYDLGLTFRGKLILSGDTGDVSLIDLTIKF